MQDDQLKNKIKKEYEKITPDIKDRVLLQCNTVVQEECDIAPVKKHVWLKRIAVFVACLIFFVGGTFVGLNFSTLSPTVQAETILFLDVNPSVELSLDMDNRVISVACGNEDAEEVLQGLKLEDVELNTALNAIVGSMYIHGYLSEDSNSILVSVDTKHNENERALLSYVTEKINTVFEKSNLKCSILAQGVEIDDDLKQRAKEQGVSIGKMHLIDKLLEKEEFVDSRAEDLSFMSIKDLNHIYSTFKSDDQNTDIVSGNVNGYIIKEEAIRLLLLHLNLECEDLESVEMIAMPKFVEGLLDMNYRVTLKIKNDQNLYYYEIDCISGEIENSIILPTPSFPFPDMPPQMEDMPEHGVPNEGNAPPPNLVGIG